MNHVRSIITDIQLKMRRLYSTIHMMETFSKMMDDEIKEDAYI